jgi:predicted nucleic acid-binding protein
VPLLIIEQQTNAAKALYERDPNMIVWWATRAECVHAICRRRRDGTLSSQGEQQAKDVLAVLAERWSEVQPTTALRALAVRCLHMYPLVTADALQLAAALTWRGQPHQGRGFVSFDDKENRSLQVPARTEGFQVLPPQM